MALLANGLLPASFRGAPFAVFGDEVGGGRRVALHVYPGRDDPWAEDMGRAPRTFRFRGFIIDGDVVFRGGPIQLQRALLLAALEKSGPGALVHPTLGLLNVSVTRFAVGQDLGAGRFSTVDIEFVESGRRQFPTLLTSSSGLLSAANLCKVAIAADAVRVISALSSAGERRSDIEKPAAAWAAQVESLGSDATALHRLTAQLPGSYGRFVGGGNSGLGGRVVSSMTLGDLVAQASARRAAIAAAAARVVAVSATIDLTRAEDLAAAVTAMVQALADACADPADAIRLLVALVAFEPLGPEAASALGVALAQLVRRVAAAVLVTVVGAYQPSSADDAGAMIVTVSILIDDAATVAADAGDDASYRALRDARGAAVRDLRTRGATLAQVTRIRSQRPVPALALAQRLYGDASRADQLVTQTAAPSPLFMPIDFEALAA